jgi:hypothetical protein
VADSTVIKEFLVALGFKTDETAIKKFTGGIAASTKAVVALGAAVEGAVLGVVYFIDRFASNLENLYFAAQRTGSSADQLQAFALASRNFGSSMEEAMGAAENLATYMRKNPGGQSFISGWLRQVGIDSRNLHGEVDWLKGISKLFTYQREHGQMFMAENLASQWGISEHQLLAMSTPGYAAELDKQEKHSRGWKAASEAAHRFENQMADAKMFLEQSILPLVGPLLTGEGGLIGKLTAFISHHGKQIVKDVEYLATGLLDWFSKVLDWLDNNGDAIQKDITGAFGVMKTVYDTIKPAMIWLYDKFIELNTATDGWLAKIVLLIAALKLIGATGIITGIVSMGAALATALGAGLSTGLAALTAASGAGGALGIAATTLGMSIAAAVGVGLAAIIDHFFPNNWLALAGRWLGSSLADAADSSRAHSKMVNGGVDPTSTVDSAYYTVGKDGKSSAVEQPYNKTLNSSVDFHVHGVPDTMAQRVADAIALHQRDINASIIREFAPDSR